VDRILVARIVHDLSLSSWFGGELAGAVALNGAAAQLPDPRQRSRAANAGWSRFSPVLMSSVAAHLASGAVLVKEDKGRLKTQQGFARGSAIKTALTGGALAGTVYQQVLGRRMAKGGDQPVMGATQPSAGTAPEQASAQRQLNVLQFMIPALTGSAWIVHSANGELARPAHQAQGTLSRVTTIASGRSRSPLVLAAAGGTGLLAAIALKRRGSGAAQVSAPPAITPPATPARVSPPPVNSAPAPVQTPQVGTQQVETGQAQLGKHVVTETVTQTVPVTHEEPVVEREPITDANRAQAMAGEPIKEDTYEVTLHAEEPVVHKETVPVEPVRLESETVTEHEQVSTEQMTRGKGTREQADPVVLRPSDPPPTER